MPTRMHAVAPPSSEGALIDLARLESAPASRWLERPVGPTAVDVGLRRRLRATLATTRPRQWIKNLLVLAAPLSAGALLDRGVVLGVLAAFVAFTAAAAGTYLVNDALDAERDREHPVKRYRPVALGLLPERAALRLGAAAMLGAVLLPVALGAFALAATVAVYLAITIAYSTHLKHIAILDIAAVALGFVLRAAAGGAATGIALSDWFIVVVSFGALFLASGKRLAEVRALGPHAATRPALRVYTVPFLRHVVFSSLTITVLAYCAWTFTPTAASPWLTVSVLPLVVAVLRYALLLEQGRGEAPEDVLLHDRPLQATGALFALTFAAGVYLPW